MAQKDYEIVEHTADLGIRVRGKDLQDLFINAARAVFDIIASSCQAKTPECRKINITQKADDVEQLLVNWLNELLSLSAVKGLIFTDFKIKKLDAHNLEAVVSGADSSGYAMNKEIKAATYHELKVRKSSAGWQAEVILDV